MRVNVNVAALLFGLCSAFPLPAESSLIRYNASSAMPYNATFDRRSLIVNGQRALFLSGSLHPPRIHEDDWPAALMQARELGLNMVDVYVFWNFHQPEEGGALRWDGRGNITRFLALAADAGLFVNLRVGPYICAEWSYGGIPVWVGNKPNMTLRSSTGPWTIEVEAWLQLLMRRVEPWLAINGGPIVLAQIENELNSAMPGPGDPYVDWCGEVVQQWPSLVWTMCNGATAANTINSAFAHHRPPAALTLTTSPPPLSLCVCVHCVHVRARVSMQPAMAKIASASWSPTAKMGACSTRSQRFGRSWSSAFRRGVRVLRP